MKKHDVILVNSQDISKIYGVGSYVNNLKEELSKHQNFKVIYVEVNFGDTGAVSVKHSKITSIYISIKNSYPHVDTVSSIATIIFHTILLNSNVKKGIFHLNTILDFELCKIAKENNFKVVLTQHVSLDNFSHKFYSSEKLWKATRSFYSLLDGCIFLSEATKITALNTLNFPEEKSAVIYNGVRWKRNNKSKRSLRTEMGFQQDDFIAIFVGRIDRYKGIYDLVEAFNRFSQDDNRKKLIIIGDGNFKEVLKYTRQNINNFLFTGFLDKIELSKYYKIADIGVLPSYSEQSSLAVIEMIHNNIPLILSEISGFDIFQNHEVIKTHIDIKNKEITVNVEELYRNIQILYENIEIRKKLVKNTAVYREYLMNIKYSTAQTIEFYEKII